MPVLSKIREILSLFLNSLKPKSIDSSSEINRNTLLQINATIITGLLILLSLQSLSAPIYEAQVNEHVIKMNENWVKLNKAVSLEKTYCKDYPNYSGLGYLDSNDTKNKCKEWFTQVIELTAESSALRNSSITWGIIKNDTASNIIRALIWNPWQIKVTVLLMTIPFVSSALVEVCRRKATSSSSSLSALLLALGFCFLLLGILMITIMVNCAVPNPMQWCPTVQ